MENKIENKVNNKKQSVILIVAGILIFLVGVGLGITLQNSNKAQARKVQAVNNLVSKVVSSIVAYGQVENIDGRNITLSNLGDNLVISIADNAQVYSFTTPVAGKNGATAPVQQTVKFEDIKIGDNVNVAVKLSPSGQMQGSSVIILPMSAK